MHACSPAVDIGPGLLWEFASAAQAGSFIPDSTMGAGWWTAVGRKVGTAGFRAGTPGYGQEPGAA